ncbi:hypothetical protein G3I60_28030 [Streptomyces sp. SID13666]|uniref:Integral membrane protein n=1 Tax=Streptomyces fildesensis TaxID=375757 RepID=A0ABW8BY35_9ACTN|nr:MULTISPECIES: hypothetical protein [Streptomyces]MCZ4098372.1 hypothetical protein [Streptomyces sp. H39-C1]NEA57903.1 hypothetical protein [Streptomyces sp. SID13666]NEA74965.1 hypothetical protein [Streptomyces sp. SID13588]QNA75517.1 hypothetical protein C8250_029770 [Streptomyces sp. So13.3]
MSTLKKAKGFKKSKLGLYISIGTTLFGAVSTIKQARNAQGEHDRLMLADAVISAAAIATGLALLVRELRSLADDDVLAD